MASLVSYGMCQTACNAGAVACYAGAGATFGAVTAGAGTAVAVLACNSIQGSCMAVCAAKFLAEGSAETAASGGVMGPVVAVGGTLLGIAGGVAAASGAATASGAAAAGGAAGGAAAVGGSAAATGAAAAGGAVGGAAAGSGAAVTTGVWVGRAALGTSALGIALTLGYVSYRVWDWQRAKAGAVAAPKTLHVYAPGKSGTKGNASSAVGLGVPGAQGISAVPVAGAAGPSRGPVRQGGARAADASSRRSSSEFLMIPHGGVAHGDAAIICVGDDRQSSSITRQAAPPVASNPQTVEVHVCDAEIDDAVAVPEFPTDIQVVTHARASKGRVINIQQGLILVDFADGHAPQLLDPLEVSVLPNDLTAINNSCA